MNARTFTAAATLAVCTAALPLLAAAQTATGTTPSTDTSTSTTVGAPDNTNSRFNEWMTDYSGRNQGRISRQAYMDEVGRRWDMMDREQRGLTTDEINRAYGYPSPGTPERPNNSSMQRSTDTPGTGTIATPKQ